MAGAFGPLFPVVTSKKSFAYRVGSEPISYSAGLIRPSRPPLIWSAMAISPAHCGEPDDVPPTMYQPELHGGAVAAPHGAPRLPLGGGTDRYTSTPVRELAW